MTARATVSAVAEAAAVEQEAAAVKQHASSFPRPRPSMSKNYFRPQIERRQNRNAKPGRTPNSIPTGLDLAGEPDRQGCTFPEGRSACTEPSVACTELKRHHRSGRTRHKSNTSTCCTASRQRAVEVVLREAAPKAVVVSEAS